MKPNNLIMYIADNNIILWHNDNTYTEKVIRKSICYGKIYNTDIFIKSFANILKKHKLNKGMLNNNIYVILDPNYSQLEIEALKYCLEKLSFNKINFINVLDFHKFKKNNIFIIIHKNYLHISYLNYKQRIESVFVDFRLFSNNTKILCNCISSLIKKKKIIIFGFNHDTEMLAQKIEEYTHNKTFYINDPCAFILNKIKNTL